MSAIRWHRGHDAEDTAPEPGDWYAEVGGQRIARVSIHYGTPTGYWGRYRGGIYGKREVATTLGEFKEMTAKAHAARTAGGGS